MDSENGFVKAELEKYEKWKNFITFYIDPIKQRYKEGLLAPTNNEVNTFGNFEKNFMDFKSFDQQEKEIEEKTQQPEPQKKLPMREFLKQSSQEYIQGKKIEVLSDKKEETMEIIQDEEEDHFMGENIHPHVISYNEKPHIENHEFYDNNFWKPGVIVDEVALLEELTRS